MAKTGTNIHKRKDGRWEGRFEKGRDEKGAIIYGYVYDKKYKDVKEKLMAAQANISSAPDGDSRPFSEVLDLWLQHNKIRQKGSTVAKYRFLTDNHVKPDLGNIPINEITATMVNQYLTDKLENGRKDNGGGLSPSYVRTLAIIIGSALKFAESEGLYGGLRSRIYKPSLPKKALAVLTLEDQRKLEDYLVHNVTPTNTGILLSLRTGLRIGEVCALSWEDVDLNTRILHVKHTVSRVVAGGNEAKTKLIVDTPKTNASTRDIPISSSLQPILEQAKKTAVSPFVASEDKEFVNPRTFEYRYHKVLSRCDIAPVNFHALRHTFATRCIEAGVDVKSLSEILGHANAAVTLETYVHSSMNLKRSQLEKLENIIPEK